MNTLTIDIGNTRTKYDFWSDKGFLFRKIDASFDEIIGEIKSWNVKGVIVSSVKRDTDGLRKAISESTGCFTLDFNREEINRYGNLIQYKGNIGADRVAAYLGAVALKPKSAMLIVDMGTAMTLDIADKDERFCGGNISLGLASRAAALSGATSLLPEVSKIDEYISFGHDTVSSIQSGAVNGVIGEIKFAAQRARRECDAETICLTGGDAKWISTLLQSDLDCIFDEYLVGRGLDRHLRLFYSDVLFSSQD